MISLSSYDIGLALLAGIVLGMVFFGGLWLTVQQLHSNKHPALLIVASVVLRFCIVLMCFYWLISSIHWPALLIALAGFLMVRAASLRWGNTQ